MSLAYKTQSIPNFKPLFATSKKANDIPTREWHWPSYFKDVPFPKNHVNLVWPKNRPYGVGLKGGRASGKSYTAAQWLIRCLLHCPNARALVLRETGSSLTQSFKQELVNVINEKDLHDNFEVLHTEIRCKHGVGSITFKPLSDHTSENVKSIAKINICVIEEAQQVTLDSLNKLFATFRESNLFWMAVWNPRTDEDPILTKIQSLIDVPDDHYKAFSFNKPVIIHSTYLDNKWCSDVTRITALSVKQKDIEYYMHEWLGLPLNINKAKILSRYKIVDSFNTTNMDGPFHGMDFGSVDPTTLVKTYINPIDKIIYIENATCCNSENNSVTDAYNLVKHIDPSTETIAADSAAKQIIIELRNKDVPIVSVSKKPIVTSLFNLRQYTIYINKQCIPDDVNQYSILTDLKKYQWKKENGKYIDQPIDKFNHFIDALRYSINTYL